MKKKTITIGALLLAMTSFSQTDTLAYSISEKYKYKFDYYSSSITQKVVTKDYEDFEIKLKKNQVIYLDLSDHIGIDTSYLMYRNVTVCYRDNYIDKLYLNSNNKTYRFNGKFVRKIVIHKPKLK